MNERKNSPLFPLSSKERGSLEQQMNGNIVRRGDLITESVQMISASKNTGPSLAMGSFSYRKNLSVHSFRAYF